LTEILTPLVDQPEAQTIAKGWAARHSEVVEQVNKTLASAGLSTDSILAQTFSLQVDHMERIQHLTALAETRRNATLREIDRHRQTLGRREPRRAAQQLEDGQFQVIENTLHQLPGKTVV
jgi:hypothetical protein